MKKTAAKTAARRTTLADHWSEDRSAWAAYLCVSGRVSSSFRALDPEHAASLFGEYLASMQFSRPGASVRVQVSSIDGSDQSEFVVSGEQSWTAVAS